VPIYNPDRAVIVEEINGDWDDRGVEGCGSAKVGTGARNGVEPLMLRGSGGADSSGAKLAVEGRNGIDSREKGFKRGVPRLVAVASGRKDGKAMVCARERGRDLVMTLRACPQGAKKYKNSHPTEILSLIQTDTPRNQVTWMRPELQILSVKSFVNLGLGNGTDRK
jgi:hypothetical protein